MIELIEKLIIALYKREARLAAVKAAARRVAAQKARAAARKLVEESTQLEADAQRNDRAQARQESKAAQFEAFTKG